MRSNNELDHVQSRYFGNAVKKLHVHLAVYLSKSAEILGDWTKNDDPRPAMFTLQHYGGGSRDSVSFGQNPIECTVDQLLLLRRGGEEPALGNDHGRPIAQETFGSLADLLDATVIPQSDERPRAFGAETALSQAHGAFHVIKY